MRIQKVTILILIAIMLYSVDAVSGPFDKIKGAKLPGKSGDKPAAESVKGTNPKSIQVFNDNKENLKNSLEILRKFTGTQDASAQREMAEQASDYVKLGEATLKNFKTGIIEGVEEFEANYAEAKNFRLKSNIGFLETYIEKTKDAMSGVRTSLLKSVISDVEWLGSPEANAQYASKALENINNVYAALDKIWKNDSEIKAHKDKNIPLAKKNYDKIMKQADKNRMPKSVYSGGDKAALEKKIAAAYKERYAQDQVVRVVITSPNWQEKTEVGDDNVKLYIKSYLTISAHVAVKKGEVANVFALSFRKPKSGGNLELGGVGNSYPITMKNINK
jgi:hypothetical protein